MHYWQILFIPRYHEMQLLVSLLFILLQMLPMPEDITLLFAGDAMQHGPQIAAAKRSSGKYDYSKCFEYVKPAVSSADYAVVNLECPLAGKPYTGYPCFSAPDDYAEALKDAGFDMFLVANNHALDKRDKGAHRTIDKLSELEIPSVGLYHDKEHRLAASPFVATIGDFRVAFVGYTYGTNGIGVQGNLVVNYINADSISHDIVRARKLGAELVCVLLHWGVEYAMTPNFRQKELTELLIDAGADMIIGGHPHVVQPFEMRFNPRTGRNVLVVYSLGNFLSNQNDTNSRGGAMVNVVISRQGTQAYIKSASYDLVFVQKPTYQLIPAWMPELVGKSSQSAFETFCKNARRLFSRYNVAVSESTH